MPPTPSHPRGESCLLCPFQSLTRSHYAPLRTSPRLFLTKVHADFECDVHFPDLAPYGLGLNSSNKSLDTLTANYQLEEDRGTDVDVDQTFSENGTSYTFHVYKFVLNP